MPLGLVRDVMRMLFSRATRSWLASLETEEEIPCKYKYHPVWELIYPTVHSKQFTIEFYGEFYP